MKQADGGRPLRVRAVRAGVLAALLVPVLAGCSGADGDGAPSGSAGSASSEAATQAATALIEAGLRLPDGASAVSVTEKPHEVFTDRYVITFNAPAAEVESLCRDAQLNGPLRSTVLNATQAEVLGMEQAPEGARLCYGSDPADPRRQRTVVFAGDPAQVWVAIWQMPER